MKIKITSRGKYIVMEDGTEYTFGDKDTRTVAAMVAARLMYDLENPNQKEE